MAPNRTALAPTSTSAVRLLETLLRDCVEHDASDLHLAPKLPPYLRLHGVLQPQADHPGVSPEQIEAIGAHLAVESDRSPLEGPGSLDGAISAADGTRFRFNVYRRQGKLAIALMEPGQHALVLRYLPWDFIGGLVVSIVTAIGLAVHVRRSRGAPSQAR